MAFEFKLSTDEIREKMFNFIKPVYKNTWDFEVGYINWVYGVYDSEDKFFITYVNSKNDNTKYLLITGNGDIFYNALKRYINAYAEEYPDKLKAIVPLIEFVKVHAKSKYLKDAVKKM